MDIKKPRLFYWSDAQDAWCPVHDGWDVGSIIGVENFTRDQEVIEIQFKRSDMTDKVFDAIEEV